MLSRITGAVAVFLGSVSLSYEPGDDVPPDFKMPKPLPRVTALKTLKTRPGLQIELVAAEPLTMDPIAIDFGPDGKLWVVEMADYPLGMDGKNLPGGRVRFLTDSDGDGKFDKSTLFLDALNFPTGVKSWKNGVLVVAAPDIFYAEDTTGDGIADKREVLFTGFREGNQQHRVNGLVWGLDNFLHLANGDSGGTIRSLKTGETLELGSFDLKIRPDTGEMVKTSGRTQYGRVRDDSGNWFGCSNSKPMFQFVLKQEILEQNPHVIYPPAAVPITEPAYAPKVFPTSAPALRYNTPGATSRITSACGLTIYRDDALGDQFSGNAFICEPVHNLVTRRVLTRPEGELIFQAKRAPDEQESEFFTSTDPWCRPVFATTGPDGALWIVDMHRYVIEHPEWIPDAWQKVLDLRAGHELGRIYRIQNGNCGPAAHKSIARKTDVELVAMLESKNGRLRDMAHQLLFELGVDAKTNQQGLFTQPTLLDHSASKYEVAVALANVIPKLESTVRKLPPDSSPIFVKGLFETVIGTGKRELIGELLSDNQAERYAMFLSVLDRRKISLADFVKKLPAGGKMRLAECSKFSETARETVVDGKAKLDSRIGAVNLLGRAAAERGEDIALLEKQVAGPEPKLAIASVKRLGEMREFGFLGQLASVGPEVRRVMLSTAAGHRTGVETLLAKAKAGEFPLALIDAATRSQLTSSGNGALRKRAQKLFASATTENRAAVLETFAGALKIKNADAKAGRMHFQALCAACHELDGVGVAGIGPDLRGLSDKSADALFVAILDPNRAVEDKYLLTTVTANDGSTLVGMIGGESGDGVALKKLDGTTETISRSGITKLETTGVSAMPEGLEAALDERKLAELLAFLKGATK
ncbi:MAG: c-type cytochrome [Verrucomicrobiales bacterium]|nr:c-type cytochrome [Verrucomicrobiales bacterium]